MPEKIIKIVVVGHVDHGKSTLVGRLLCDTGQIMEDRKDNVRRVCEKNGRKFEFAFLLDALEEEQKQGITLDSSEIRWQFEGRNFIFIDTPGHKELLKNMVTGASRADAAVILLDAGEGVSDQFRRHSYILRMLGLREIVVAVNKMDLVSYDERVYRETREKVRVFLEKIGLSPSAVIPVSALNGDNLLARSGRMKWYKGRPLCGALCGLGRVKSSAPKPLRFTLQDTYKVGEKRIYAGRVESGSITAGQKVFFSPSGETATVKSIEKWHCPPTKKAFAGESVGITLHDAVFLERGSVGSELGRRPAVSSLVHVNVFWMGERPMSAGRVYRLKLAAQEVNCRIDSIEKVIDAASFEELECDAGSVAKNNVGDMVLKLEKPLACDEFALVAPLGRFVIAEENKICGGGIIVKGSQRRAPVHDKIRNQFLFREKSRVAIEEREKLNGHPAFVIWLTGLSGAGKSTLARELERVLFSRNVQVFFMDGDNIRGGINRDLGFSSAERLENIRRVGEIAKLFVEAGIVTVTAFISPFEDDREMVRKMVGSGRFVEVFLDCPIGVCVKRDTKGLYEKAKKGELLNFTGISAPYERPEKPDITIRTDRTGVKESVEKVLEYLDKEKGIKLLKK